MAPRTGLIIPLGNYQIAAPASNLMKALTTSGDWTVSDKDSVRLRYVYNTNPQTDTNASLPSFYQNQPYQYHLVALSEYHTFTPNLTNEIRVGYHRYLNDTPSGPFTYPGLDAYPNLRLWRPGTDQLRAGPERAAGDDRERVSVDGQHLVDPMASTPSWWASMAARRSRRRRSRSANAATMSTTT